MAAAVKKALKKAFEKQDRSDQLHNVSTRTRSVPSARLCVPPLVGSTMYDTNKMQQGHQTHLSVAPLDSRRVCAPSFPVRNVYTVTGAP